MRRRLLTFAPLMALLAMGQMIHEPLRTDNITVDELEISPPFITPTSMILPTQTDTISARVSQRFAFAFAARTTTTTLLPQTKLFDVPSSTTTTTRRPRLQFLRPTTSSPFPENSVSSTLSTLIDADTGVASMAFKDEKLPLASTLGTTIPLTTLSTTTTPSMPAQKQLQNGMMVNRTTSMIRPFLRRLGNGTRPMHQLRVLATKERHHQSASTSRPSTRNPVRIAADNRTLSTRISPQLRTQLNPELDELRKRIAAGIMAQKLLRERLKQAAASRFQTTAIQKMFPSASMPSSKLKGVSRRKSAVPSPPKQRGVKTTQGEKQRSEGRLHRFTAHIKTGRAGSPSPVIAKRFHSDDGDDESSISTAAQQVEVAPSSVQMEKIQAASKGAKIFSAGPSMLIDELEKALNGSLYRTTKHEPEHREPTSFELESQPAFCRRCFRFWKNVSAVRASRSIIFQYCCTSGSNKGSLFRKLKETVNIRT